MKYYLSVPCAGCPCVSRDLKAQACLAMHSASLSLLFRHHQPHHINSLASSHVISIIMHSLANVSLILILEDKGGPTPGH